MLENRSSSFAIPAQCLDGLVERRLAVHRHRAPLIRRWEWGLNEETPTSWGRLPLASSYSPGGSGVVVHTLGRRSGPTLPHREAKVSGVVVIISFLFVLGTKGRM